jgi:GTP cyclohydrolase I
MKDIQNEIDNRGILLEKVGIKGLSWPVKVLNKVEGYQNTVADIDISVELEHSKRGTHMSRFIEAMNDFKIINPKNIEKILNYIGDRLNAEKSYIKITFPYFVWKKSPVSNKLSPLKVECEVIAEKSEDYFIVIGVKVPVQTVCPCSKEISDFGAHNQRAIIKILIKLDNFKEMIWYEDLIKVAEANASSPVYELLKREDEKFVTENGYNNPKLVEDVVRDITIELDRDNRVTWYEIEVVSYESIHDHQAFALIKKGIKKCL